MNKAIWFDLDNLPHVSLFRPVFKELEKRNLKYIITARDFNHTLEQLKYWNINHTAIGRHGGKNKIKKIVNLFERSYQLKKYIKNFDNIGLAVSHGSRTQVVAAKWLGIKSLVMMDYEYTETKIFNYLSTYMLIPRFIPDSRLASVGLNLKKIIRYNGFKEQIYINNFQPDLGLRKKLGISQDKMLVTIRPPGIVGNYHDSFSEKILLEILEEIIAKNIQHFVISRTKEDRELIINKFGSKVNFLNQVVDGLQLIWNSDVFISGGGTMNREAALLGVPTYSIFTGKKPYLDEYLSMQGKLTFIDSLEKVDLIDFSKKRIRRKYNSIKNNLSKEVVDIIMKAMNK